MSLFLFLIIVAMVLGLIGAAAEGLTYLLVIGVLVLVGDLIWAGLHLAHRRSGRTAR
ncbi:hypothetical protein [Wenjunlia tyrosinilytica]|uniref:Uncharacterized protein n=1 Tax=Wenjunlia tyrosinilytica TaxID=1544741 RepID=A0A917ZQP5_9ACTN|nr:hypothetical protein [Wenjunlia tyrosinilytica]GGO87909.1 hypothetical protein GCM10012280_27470 [Wenjunlia tyrosinilytica]